MFLSAKRTSLFGQIVNYGSQFCSIEHRPVHRVQHFKMLKMRLVTIINHAVITDGVDGATTFIRKTICREIYYCKDS